MARWPLNRGSVAAAITGYNQPARDPGQFSLTQPVPPEGAVVLARAAASPAACNARRAGHPLAIINLKGSRAPDASPWVRAGAANSRAAS